MNIPIKKQKVVAYNKLQSKGLVIKVDVITTDSQPLPSIGLWMSINDKSIFREQIKTIRQ